MQASFQPVSLVVQMAPKQAKTKCVAPASAASGADEVSKPPAKKQKTLSSNASKSEKKEDAPPSKLGKALSKTVQSRFPGAKAKVTSKTKASSAEADKGNTESKAWTVDTQVQVFDYCWFLSILCIQSLGLYHQVLQFVSVVFEIVFECCCHTKSNVSTRWCVFISCSDETVHHASLVLFNSLASICPTRPRPFSTCRMPSVKMMMMVMI